MLKKNAAKKGRRRPSTTQNKASTPSVFSYHASRSQGSGNTGRDKQEESERPVALRKSRSPRLKRTFQVAVCLLAGALLVSNMLLASTPKIVVVGADDSQVFLRDKKMYQDAGHRILTSSVFNSNKLTVDVENMRAQLKAEFPELADVSVSLPLIGRQPIVYVQPSTSRLLLNTKSGESFILDGTGKAIASGQQAESFRKVAPPEVKDESGIPVQLGSVVMPSASVTFITEVARQLKTKDIAIAEMALPAGNSELHVRLQGLPYAVKFNMRGNAREETGAFLATKQYVESQRKGVAEYIDVRVDNRVYYR